jgi:hypothetical protein
MMLREWRTKWPILLLLAGAFGLLLAIVVARASHRQTGELFVSDGFGYYIYLPSVVLDGDLDLSNQLAHQPDQRSQTFYQVTPATGLPANPFQVGCAIFWSPFFLIAHAAAKGLAALGVRVPANGFGYVYELPVYCGAFFYGLVGLFYIYRLLQELWGASVARIATLYLALASPAAAYLWFEPDMSHGLSLTLIAMLFFYLYRAHATDNRSGTMWAFLGFLVGAITLVRVPDALVSIAVGCVALSFIQGRASSPPASLRQILRCSAAFLVAAGLTFLPQLLVWKALYGSFLLLPSSTNYDRMNWYQPDFLGYLFSTRRGIFLWTPLLLPAVLGLIAGVWKGPSILRYALLVLIAAVYFNCSIPKWWTGCSFSERRIVDYTVLFALGLGYLLSLRPALSSRYALHFVGVCLCLFNWTLMTRYFTHELPEYGDVSFNDLFVGTVTFLGRHLGKFV